ncbi:hypothetical protein BGZ83_002197 [Gryganskiella cystojenkinii]|nr:hypothetical protein BGZ83_002197 [Gryganskiella cystojenkinii]
MAWKQSCIKNIFTGNMDCIKWGISSSKIDGMTQINHRANVRVQSTGADAGASAAAAPSPSSPPMMTLVDLSISSPSLPLMPSLALLGFSVPGVFDLGATADIQGSVSLSLLVQAARNLIFKSDSVASCPWSIDWNGSLTSTPSISFGLCTLPDSPTISVSNIRARSLTPNNNIYFGFEDESRHDDNNQGAIERRSSSRQTAKVTVGLTVTPGVHLGLTVVGISGISTSLVAPLNLNINANWDSEKSVQCDAGDVAINADAGASLALTAGFFGFTGAIPIVKSPQLVSPAACINL